MYAVKFQNSSGTRQLILSVARDAGYALILPWMPVPVSMITLTQVVSGTSTVVARAAIGREIPDLKHLALTVDGMQAKVYFRGRLLMTGTLSTTMTIDRVELQGGTKDTLLSEMLLMPRVAEPEDIAMWHNLRAPFYDPSPHIPAEHQPVTVKGAGADIDIDKFGIRATRKADGKKTFEIDAETGSAFFKGDITGATGTFSGSLEAKSIKAEWFEEIRNVLPYTGSDSLDADHPIDYDFYIPSETTEIIAVKVSAVGLPFRAYSRSVKSAKSQTSTSTSWSWGGATTSTNGTHTHTFSVSGSWGSTNPGGDHSHTVQIPSHHHDVTIPEHNHDMEHGIFHSTLPANVKLYCDDGHGWGSPISLGNGGVLATELDITSHFSGPGWKRIRFTSSRLGRITWQIIVKVDLTA